MEAVKPATGPSAFLSLVKHPVKFRLFLLRKLPSAYFSGIRVREADEEHCVVTVPFGWFSQNPFRSTYFACLAMAAEMSTGVLAMAAVWGRKPSVSMLVVGMEADFYKKATGVTRFICRDGHSVQRAVEAAIRTGEGQTVQATSEGFNEEGEKLATFRITWSFKAKGSRS